MKKLFTALFALALLGGLAQAESITPVPTTGISVPVKAPLPPPQMNKDCGSRGC